MQLEYFNSPYKDIFTRFDIGLLEEMFGGFGGEAKKISKNSILVPSKSTARIQEMHILIIHIICEMIEDLRL